MSRIQRGRWAGGDGRRCQDCPTFTPSNLFIALYLSKKGFLLFQTSMSLTAVVLAHYSSSALLFLYAPSKSRGNVNANEQAKLIASKAKFLKARIGQRDKLKGDLGNWYLLRGTETLLCAACVTQDYPERLAYALLQKLQAIVQEKPPKEDESEKKVKGLNKELTAVCQKYKDACADKVKQAQKAANELKMELNKGVNKLIGNQQNLNQINDKASLMKDYAKSFEKNAETIEKVMCWRKYKFFVIIGIVLIVVFLAAGLTIYCKTH